MGTDLSTAHSRLSFCLLCLVINFAQFQRLAETMLNEPLRELWK